MSSDIERFSSGEEDEDDFTDEIDDQTCDREGEYYEYARFPDKYFCKNKTYYVRPTYSERENKPCNPADIRYALYPKAFRCNTEKGYHVLNKGYDYDDIRKYIYDNLTKGNETFRKAFEKRRSKKNGKIKVTKYDGGMGVYYKLLDLDSKYNLLKKLDKDGNMVFKAEDFNPSPPYPKKGSKKSKKKERKSPPKQIKNKSLSRSPSRSPKSKSPKSPKSSSPRIKNVEVEIDEEEGLVA
jgi:hypothetical protein